MSEEVELCSDEYWAYLQCFADEFNGNCLPSELPCDAEKNVWFACQDAESCQSWSCDEDGTACDCNGLCKNQDLEQVCQFTDGGIDIPCDCYVDGAFIGSCTTDGNACDIQSGCCFDLL